MRTPSASLMLLLMAMDSLYLANGISFKQIYSKAKLLSVNENKKRKVEQSAAFLKKRNTLINDDYDDEEANDAGPRLYDLEDSPELFAKKRKSRTYRSGMKRPHHHVNIVQEYTKSLPATVLVSLSSAMTSVLISAFLSMMLFSSVWWGLVKVCVALCFTSGLMNNILGDLSRSLGVFLILLLKKSWFTSSIKDLLSLVAASMRLSKRRPFPPGTNPWRYERVSATDPDFNMYRTLAVLLLLGSYVGRVISCFVPLIPTWIDVLVAGGGFAYAGTLATPQGDLARYIGFGVVASWRHMAAVAEEVQLLPKAEVVTDRVASYASKINKEHGVVSSLQKITSVLYHQITQASSRVQAEMNGEDPEPDIPEGETYHD